MTLKDLEPDTIYRYRLGLKPHKDQKVKWDVWDHDELYIRREKNPFISKYDDYRNSKIVALNPPNIVAEFSEDDYLGNGVFYIKDLNLYLQIEDLT